jgi:hypothetical protein
MAAPGRFNENHLTELEYDFRTLWPVLVLGLMLSVLLLAVAPLAPNAGHQRILRLVAPAPALAAAIVFALYWLWL